MSCTYMLQYVSYSLNKFQVSYLPRNLSYCQVPYLEMLGTRPVAGIYETVRY